MKKSLLLAAALACSGAVAQEKEIWACQQEDTVALGWKDGKYEIGKMVEHNLLLTINGSDSEAKLSDQSGAFSLNCEYESERGLYVSCLSITAKSALYYLDLYSGRLGVSSLFGILMDDSERNQSPLSIEVYNCTKF